MRELATVSVAGALQALSDNPKLIKLEYPELVAALAGKTARLVKSKKLTGVQAKDLMEVATQSLAENPKLFLDIERKLAEGIVDAVVNAAGKGPEGIIAGAALVRLTNEVFGVMAKKGRSATRNHPTDELLAQLESLLTAGLTRAENEIGHTLSMPTLPDVLGQLVEAWSAGNVGLIDPENSNFKQLFTDLVKRSAA